MTPTFDQLADAVYEMRLRQQAYIQEQTQDNYDHKAAVEQRVDRLLSRWLLDQRYSANPVKMPEHGDSYERAAS